MSVKNISLSDQASPVVLPDWVVKHIPDLNAVFIALQSGNIDAAKSASAAIQANPDSQNALVTENLLALEDALQAGDLATAQQAFAALKHNINPAFLSAMSAASAVFGGHIDVRA